MSKASNWRLEGWHRISASAPASPARAAASPPPSPPSPPPVAAPAAALAAALAAVLLYVAADNCTVNFVNMNNDGVCDDDTTVAASGGDVDAETSVCDFGTTRPTVASVLRIPSTALAPAPVAPAAAAAPSFDDRVLRPAERADEARARCLERSFDLQVCSVEQADRLHHDASALTPSSEVSVFVTSYHTAFQLTLRALRAQLR